MRREREEWKLNFFDFFLLFGIRQSHLLSLCYKSISIFDWACDSSNESNWPIVVLIIMAGNCAHVMVQTMIGQFTFLLQGLPRPGDMCTVVQQ